MEGATLTFCPAAMTWEYYFLTPVFGWCMMLILCHAITTTIINQAGVNLMDGCHFWE